MKRRLTLTAAVSATALLSACAGGGYGGGYSGGYGGYGGGLGGTGITREHVGMATGGALGGYVGSQIGEGKGQLAATAAGALLGAVIGGAVGRSMDESDRMRSAQALESSRTGYATSWHNPDSDTDYKITPTRTYETASGPCRDFTTEAFIDGRRQSVSGTACRQPDGTWATMR